MLFTRSSPPDQINGCEIIDLLTSHSVPRLHIHTLTVEGHSHQPRLHFVFGAI